MFLKQFPLSDAMEYSYSIKRKKLHSFVSENVVRKIILEDILGKFRFNYLTEFDLNVDMVYVLYEKYFNCFFFCKD